MATQEFPIASSSTNRPVEDIDHVTPAPTRSFFSSLTIPSRFVLLVPSSIGLGLVIGMYRGGRKARLQFIAENAHRQPRTYQGWYFYAKTRNYKMMYQATLAGGKTGLALGSATAAYVFLEEYASYLREKALGVVVPREREFRRKVTWREGGSVWYDGTVAGMLSAVGVGTIWRLPRGLFVRAVWLGAILGTADSWARVMSSKVALRIPEPEKVEKAPIQPTTTAPITQIPEHPVVDREPQPSPLPYPDMNIESLVVDQPRASGKSWLSSAKSWIPGL